jgi:membrane associated rhomboid family serine protease
VGAAEARGQAVIVPYNVDVPMDRWPIANWAVIAVTTVASLWGWASPDAEAWFLWRGEEFQAAQLLTHMLLHGDPFHLAGNMLMLFVFGNAVNARLGHIAFVLSYIVCGVCAGLLWMATDGGEASLGASGAIMGVIGTFLVYYPRNDVSILIWFFVQPHIFQISAYFVILAYVAFDLFAFASRHSDGVAHAAHLGGAAAGFAVGTGLVLSGLIKPGPGEQSIFQAIKAGGKRKEERWVERRTSDAPAQRLPPELRGGRNPAPGRARGAEPPGPSLPKPPPGGWK